MKEKNATSSLFGEPSGDALTAALTRKSIRRSARKLSRRWTSMDFVVDSLFNGHRFRALTIVVNYGRECLAIEAGQSLTGADVAGVVERLVKDRGAPERIQCDNGTEFISRALDK
jgi:putative transposase